MSLININKIKNECQVMSRPGLKNIDFIELYVGNSFQAAHFYKAVLGFQIIAYAGPDTGLEDRISFVVKQGDVYLILTSSLREETVIAKHVSFHGDGVRDIAFLTDDVNSTFYNAVKHGAKPVLEPVTIHDVNHGKIIKASIQTFGETVHSFIQRFQQGWFLPHYQQISNSTSVKPTGITAIDHIAICLEKGTLNKWADFYKSTLGFYECHREDVHTEYSGMNSLVVRAQPDDIKFPLVEPATGGKSSQIDDYLRYYGSAGVQHIAFLSDNIMHTVKDLKEGGINFIKIPESYYVNLISRVSSIDEEMNALKNLGILVDRDEKGYLMQIFSKPLQSRPTLFMEIIQRKNATGFGSGNIKALFQALEQEQQHRNTM